MANIAEALKTAGAGNDLETILQKLEETAVGFNRQEDAAGPFAKMDTALLVGLNVRMLTVVKTAQQQQQKNLGRDSANSALQCCHLFLNVSHSLPSLEAESHLCIDALQTLSLTCRLHKMSSCVLKMGSHILSLCTMENWM